MSMGMSIAAEIGSRTGVRVVFCEADLCRFGLAILKTPRLVAFDRQRRGGKAPASTLC
jgi:hypothetical protein